MNKLIGLLMMIALAVAPGYALAAGNGQSCATPETLVPGYQYVGNTQNDANSIVTFGGSIDSPANDHIYSFTANSPDGFINMISADFDFAVYLVSGCTGATMPAPITYVAQNAHAVLAFSGLIVGQTYYVVVSGDANAGTGPDAYGIYSLYMPIPSAGNDGGLSCASAQKLLPGRTYAGNTLTSTNFIDEIGGVFASSANDEVYYFTPDDLGGFLYVDAANYDFGVFLTNSCTGSDVVYSYVVGSAPSILDMSTLSVGQTYYLIVTGDPSANTNINGSYSLSTLPRPDVIFKDGFDGPQN